MPKRNYLTPPDNGDQIRGASSSYEPDLNSGAPEFLNGSSCVAPLETQSASHSQSSRETPGNPEFPRIEKKDIDGLDQIPTGPRSEVLFHAFKQNYDHLLPFSFLPAETTSNELRSQKPWLYHTITMISMGNTPVEQVKEAEEIILGISQSMILGGKKSLDMIQSLILHNAW